MHRIVRGETNPWANQQDTDEDEYAYEDELEGLGASTAKDSELLKALRACVPFSPPRCLTFRF